MFFSLLNVFIFMLLLWSQYTFWRLSSDPVYQTTLYSTQMTGDDLHTAWRRNKTRFALNAVRYLTLHICYRRYILQQYFPVLLIKSTADVINCNISSGYVENYNVFLLVRVGNTVSRDEAKQVSWWCYKIKIKVKAL